MMPALLIKRLQSQKRRCLFFPGNFPIFNTAGEIQCANSPNRLANRIPGIMGCSGYEYSAPDKPEATIFTCVNKNNQVICIMFGLSTS